MRRALKHPNKSVFNSRLNCCATNTQQIEKVKYWLSASRRSDRGILEFQKRTVQRHFELLRNRVW